MMRSAAATRAYALFNEWLHARKRKADVERAGDRTERRWLHMLKTTRLGERRAAVRSGWDAADRACIDAYQAELGALARLRAALYQLDPENGIPLALRMSEETIGVAATKAAALRLIAAGATSAAGAA
ncbi:MAG: hypothetical protein ACREHV_01945 [Rhizomicrobium sp.]